MTDIIPELPAPVDPTPETIPEPDPTPELGSVVFYDAAVYGEVDKLIHVGLVIHAAEGRVRVKDLGPAAESADFAAADVRLSA